MPHHPLARHHHAVPSRWHIAASTPTHLRTRNADAPRSLPQQLPVAPPKRENPRRQHATPISARHLQARPTPHVYRLLRPAPLPPARTARRVQRAYHRLMHGQFHRIIPIEDDLLTIYHIHRTIRGSLPILTLRVGSSPAASRDRRGSRLGG